MTSCNLKIRAGPLETYPYLGIKKRRDADWTRPGRSCGEERENRTGDIGTEMGSEGINLTSILQEFEQKLRAEFLGQNVTREHVTRQNFYGDSYESFLRVRTGREKRAWWLREIRT